MRDARRAGAEVQQRGHNVRGLPVVLREEGGQIVQDTAEEAATAAREAYPERTPKLRRGVRTLQMFTGGVTKHVVTHAELPLFLVH